MGYHPWVGQTCFLSVFLTWSIRRWVVALAAGVGAFLVLGLSTAVIPNPVFGRTIAPTSWAMNVLIVTSALTGLLVATYVRNSGRALMPSASAEPVPGQRAVGRGTLGGMLAYLAIGCPVCNKLALVALGSTGAIQFYAPVQPYLAVAGIVVLGWALFFRLRGELTCRLGTAVAGKDEAVAPQEQESAVDKSRLLGR